jgi:hypothetical protein
MVSEEKYNFAELEFMPFFGHFMPLISAATFLIMFDQRDAMIGQGRWGSGERD